MWSIVIIVALLIVICILAIKLVNLRTRERKLQAEKEQWREKDRQREQRKDEWRESEDAAEQALMGNLQEFYKQKSSCMTSNESRYFYYLREILSSQEFSRFNYWVFPQVSLHAFLTLTDYAKNADRTLYSAILKSYTSKNIDFLICQCVKVENHHNGKLYSNYQYKPAMAIELDGKSHNGPCYNDNEPRWRSEDNFRRQKDNDHFKNVLFEQLNLKLWRYEQPDNNIGRKDVPPLKEALRKNLL